MTIHLPNDLESSIQAAVQSGRFASVDDAMAEAARLLLREINQVQPEPNATGMGSIGAMREAADELDEIVANAMKRRREERDFSLDTTAGGPLAPFGLTGRGFWGSESGVAATPP